MDYFNFTAELEGYSSYFSKTIKILLGISSFVSDYYKMKEQFIKNMKISLNNLISEIKKPINSRYKLNYISPFEKNLANAITFLKEIIMKEAKENELFQNEITSPLNSFIKHINNQNTLVCNEFKISVDEIYKQKEKCDSSKNNYIICGNKITLLSEKISNLPTNENSNEMKELNNNLNILKTKFQKYYIDYKDNINVTNKLFKEKNKEYFSYITQLKDIEESKESFMNFFLEKIDNYLKNKINNINKFENDINSIIPKEGNEEKKKQNKRYLIDEQLNNFVLDPIKKIRIKNEEFIEYETYKIKLSNLINQNRMYLKEDSKNNRINFNPQEILINTIEQNSKTSNLKKSKEDYIFNKEENVLIENLFLIEEVDKFKTVQLIEKIKNNFEYGQNIVDKVLERYTSSIGVQFLNENNFIKFSQMINAVLLNKEIQKNLFEINFAVIYIAEKTFYQKEENPFYKKYSCKLISDLDEEIKNKDFWYKLLQLRIQITIEEEIKIRTQKILREEKKKRLEEMKKKNNEINNNKIDDKNKKSGKKIFGFGIPEIVGNLFGNNMTQEEKEMEEKEKIRKKEIYNEIYDKIKVEVVIRLIKDFIVHFSCFSVKSYDVVDIISNIVNKYNIVGEEKKIKYFMAMFNSNMYSIKSSNFRISSDINNDENRLNRFMNQNYLKGNANKNNKILIILNVMKYLPFSDYKNILLIDKSTYKLIIKVLYSNLLINIEEDIPDEYDKKNKIPNVWKNPKIRIKIWEYLLNYNKNNNINYKEIVEKINKEENKQESFEIIELDVKRMWFGENETEQIRKSLNNILCSLAYLHPGLGYSQGMNCIASLLYDICGSEEEAFKIYNCILESTDYGDLFMNDLIRLNKYFYVFERLIVIYLPEVNLHLNNIKIAPKFFISPWFITLFTNAYKGIKGNGKPKVLIWILDCFIIDGWGAINKIGLCLMKHFERKILILDTDELLHFLINDIINYDFFKNSNYDRLRNIYDNLQIEDGLIENIENEYEIKKSIEGNINNSNNK